LTTNQNDAIPAALRVFVETAISEARRKMEQRKGITMTFLLLLPDGTVDRASVPEEFGFLLNDHQAKAAIFSFIRHVAGEKHAVAVAIVADSWDGWPTEKQKRMAKENPEELQRLARTKSFNEMEALGLIERRSALVATIHTPAEVISVRSPYLERANGGIDWHERIVITAPQEDFTGKGKMFGRKEDME